MHDQAYREYLNSLTALQTFDASMDAEREALLITRQSTLRDAADQPRAASDLAQRLAGDLSMAESKLRDLLSAYGSRPAPAVEVAYPEYPQTIAAAAREIDELATADAWLRRAQQQLRDAQPIPIGSVTPIGAPPIGPPPVLAGPESPTRPPTRWYWWAAGSGLIAVVASVVTVVAVLGGR